MEKLYLRKKQSYLLYLPLTILFFLLSIVNHAQVRKTFTQRTSSATPSKVIYNIKGDFTMLGNTNLTLKNYGNNTDNDQEMVYVDIDGDSNTWNSSSANLQLSTENGANPSCSTILFAGLYWTGKSDDADIFSVRNKDIYHSSTVLNTNYTMTTSRGGSSSNSYYPIYTFTGNGHVYIFSFNNTASSGTSTVTLTLDGITQPSINVTYNSGKATFNTPFTSNPAFGTSFTLNSLTRDTSKNRSESQYQSSSYANISYSTSKNYDKKVVSLKGPLASTYTTITANASDIWYPGSADDGIYVGYKEITDYVKTNGLGTYTVADIALKEGIGPTPGFSGGWGMVVIYENPLMNSRAVTLFDGYANENGSFVGDIPISGFVAVNAGQVNMKLGVMVSEGDVNKTGDYLKVQQKNTTTYIDLSHSGNTTNNFYNSTILTGGNTRNPSLQNNTGIDLCMFNIPNTGNINIANGQTSTNFKYGSNLDKFSIFGFAMSVDSYVPDTQGLISVNSINNVTNPAVLNALPGQAINYSLKITNEGTEATNNTIVSIPIPATAIFDTGTNITFNTYHGFSTAEEPHYDPVTNAIIWDLGTLPITANHPEYIYADLSFDLNVTTDCAIILNAGCAPEVSLETGTITGAGATSGTAFTNYFFKGYDNTTCQQPIDGSIKVAIDASSCLSGLAGPDQLTYCGGEIVTLNASSGASGTWSIVNGPSGNGEIFSDNTSPTSTFYSPNMGTYTLRWTTSCGTTDDVLVTFELCNVVNFDGVDDNINFKNKFNLNNGNFSIEAWIKSNVTNGNNQTILSKHLSPTANDGYDLRIINNVISFHWNNNSITATHGIDTDRWYHIAVTFDGSNYNLYIDGILEETTSGSNPIANNIDFIIGAMSQNTDVPYNYFNGWIDELRIWNTPLSADQIRRMMNQEIENDGSNNVKGAVIPKNISGLNWSNLSGYYQMNNTDDVSNGYLVDKSGNNNIGKLKGIYLPEPDTAPIPYTSGADGAWETDASWTHYDVWDPPYSLGIDNSTIIEWNIVATSHNITSAGNKTVLGLVVNSNKISANNDSKIKISSYLKLDGKIDLVGKSQLIQTMDSDLEVSSSGSIERDQQGQSNLFNYNYWSSPVGAISTTANNVNYSVGSVMKDGTTSTPKNIQWIGGYNGSPTTPISIARYWLYKFDNYANAYANWVQMNENSSVRVGQGYTMKGSGTSADTQNYTFVGKPNNGLISSNSVSANQLLLAGNPYPSSLDSKTFIEDNENSINGTIYYWEHYASNNTHILRDYQGGYATRNLTGGVVASSANVDFISKLGTPSRGIPNRFIPVGQAFFLIGKADSGGTITYNNNQRAFHKEDDAANSNVMYKITAQTKQHWQNNNNDEVVEEKYKKVRLGFTSYNDYHRQILLGFIDEKATDAIDFGYDAYNMDNLPNDMFFLINEDQFVIQGVGAFDKNASYPIGVKVNAEGIVKFMIDETENFDDNQAIYIFDSETNTYHNIKNQNFEISLVAGYTTRFSLRFYNPADAPIEPEEPIDMPEMNPGMTIIHIQKSDNININNQIKNCSVTKVRLYNESGIEIENWKIQENRNQSNIQVHIKKAKLGVYIVKVETTAGDFTKKIIIE
ncbi:LamG-like jellyroll fold domain-containing protein [Flavobacterium sp. ARAG 55.4]|uniref:LamG-like jellyroll fold domain-containing protein n=1 Tax=Flavobacterium sp. ARAG 55.4 TaxID=3451357 RepID=UPI003F44AC29